jgi:NADH:ubiquinone oxidoreductase subunit 5 (subunit L)/multisubunit Na+/H+ antiporter MnhA subunit
VNGLATITILFTKVTRWFDQGIVDGLVNGVASATSYISRTVRYLQSGYVQNYYMLISVTVLAYLFFEGKTTLLNINDIVHQVIKAFNVR